MFYKINKDNNSIIYEDRYEKVGVKINRQHFLDIIENDEPAKLNFPDDFLFAFKKPIDTLPLNNLAKGAKNISIIIPDSTRGLPLNQIFKLLIKELQEAEIRLDQIKVVIALGVHRKLTGDEIANIIGEEFFNKLNVVNHDPYDKDNLVILGNTKYGTPVEVNKLVFESDFRIVIGKVEPHEFAGFSGGRKAILPGVCSEKTIKANHRPEMILNEYAKPGSLEKNIIHLDMIEAARLLKVHFSINCVLNSKNEFIGLFIGDIFSAHQKSVNFLKSYCKVTLHNYPDIIITTPGYPLNIDFYQSIKALIAVEPICKEGSVVILYSSCPEGINSPDMLFPFQNSKNVNEVINKLKQNYKIQMDHALLLSKILNKGIHLIVYSPNIKAELLKDMFIKQANNLQQALNLAYAFFGNKKKDIKVLIYPKPQRTLPDVVT